MEKVQSIYIKSVEDCKFNYLNIEYEYLYIDFRNLVTKSYMSIKYLPYKITRLIIWDYDRYISRHNPKYINNYFYVFNYLPVNLKCLYLNNGIKNITYNLPIYIVYINWWPELQGISMKHLTKLKKNESLYMYIYEFIDKCDKYCNIKKKKNNNIWKLIKSKIKSIILRSIKN